ncbi:MAG TPA: efflux RND transporter permease subunit [Stellaceae bacterium]|nr:efflux RND transporter permease subunit [Stellaceae bacterium]
MNLSAPFIARPVATTLLTLGIALAGIFAYFKLPVAPLPQVDLPTIFVSAQLPGASPQTMATAVATPLERHLGVIADVTEMTSQSTVGSARITLQFGLDRDIDGAARDVQAAINAARADLPTSLRQNPTYRKVNPAGAPIMLLALTSDSLTRGQIYDAAATVIQQALSQISGIGQVTIGGSSLPAVRVELNPLALFKYGIGLEDVRAGLSAANAHAPKGAVEIGERRYQIYTNDQARHAADYRPLVIAYRNGAAVRLTDVAAVKDGVENIRNMGLADGKPAVIVLLYRQPGANVIATVDQVKAILPELQAAIPSAIKINVALDQTVTIRASLYEVESTLLIAIGLVVLVVFLFLRNARAALIPSVAVPVSLFGTFGVMYFLGYSLDNISLMALTISTGFVVDDAIVVLENVTRHIEAGMPRREAALRGAREVGFTVLSMSASLIAVFLPILLMGGIVGRFFREFAMTLSIAILISLIVSLTTTPMMCAHLGRPPAAGGGGAFARAGERAFAAVLALYERSLRRALRHPVLILLSLAATVACAIYLFALIPKGFFPREDTGRIIGGIRADQSISFQRMEQKLAQFVAIIRRDPAVKNVAGFTGGWQTNGGFVFATLKPLALRTATAEEVVNRLRPKLGRVAGARIFLVSAQDIRAGGRASLAEYQYTLQGSDLDAVYHWAPKVEAALRRLKVLKDVNLDQQQKGLEAQLVIDRATASRLGLSLAQIDNTLYDAFGQRQVSVIYEPRNQYHVVMEVAPQFWQSPEALKDLYVSISGGTIGGTQGTNALAGTVLARVPVRGSAAAAATAAKIAGDVVRNRATNALAATGRGAVSTGAAVSTFRETMVPLSAVAHFAPGNTPLAVNHQGLFVASTISFNLAPGVSLGQATAAIKEAVGRLGMPETIHASFQGTARVFAQSLANEPVLIVVALLTVYIVLGVLYESTIHPITILSTLPSAGVGAILALMATGTEFSIMALIGVILLIGIVKKNAIMMIDFALAVERGEGLSSREAITEACVKRFRPILMTTMAAMLGALPLAIGFGQGAELRRPLGIAIVGGLVVSQVLTLYTTPVIYLCLDRFRLWSLRHWRAAYPRLGAAAHPEPGE